MLGGIAQWEGYFLKKVKYMELVLTDIYNKQMDWSDLCMRKAYRRNFKAIATFLCMVLFFTTAKVIFAESLNAEQDEDTVIVEVIYTDCEEDEIKKWILDDGTTVGDHNYTIQYSDTVSPFSEDPFGSGSNGYFSSAAWITRDGVVSLQLAPTQKTKSNLKELQNGWNIVTSATTITSSKYWPADSTCLYWQYQCHYEFARTKTYWNLEPSRKADSYFEVVAGACNP